MSAGGLLMVSGGPGVYPVANFLVDFGGVVAVIGTPGAALIVARSTNQRPDSESNDSLQE